MGTCSSHMTIPSQSANRIRFDSFDTLRFLAALAVLISHADAMQPWPKMAFLFEGGLLHPKSAVAFFFALSGFVLHLSCRGVAPTWRTFGVFMMHRWFRIVPLYFISLLVAMVVLSCLPLADCPRFVSDEAGAEVLVRDRRDLYQWIHHALLITPGLDMQFLNPPIWTLTAEMRIALIFPWLSYLCSRLSLRGGILMLALMLPLAPWFAQKTFSTVALVPLFLIGALAAQHREKFTKMSSSKAWCILATGIIIYSFSCSLRSESFKSQVLHMQLAAFGSAMIMLSVLRLSVLRRILEHRWLVFSGRASYGVYILHFPLFMALTYFSWRFHWPSWLLMFAGMIGVLLLASILYRVVEQPMIRFGRNLGSRIFIPRL
jgi:peptidoglycan/LPS O-acetylase OafA/YrhL